VSPLNIFLDNGGVITGKERQAAEFERLVGNCLVPLLGGTEEAWVRAHRVVVDRLADPQSARALAADFVGFYRAYQLRWVGGMCELEGMGVRRCFGRLYGADLINTFKEGSEYYARLFADAGIQPAAALVVDDSAEAIEWAARLGARTALISSSPHPQTSVTSHLGSLAELPAFLRQWW
jgi:hypothetical protein